MGALTLWWGILGRNYLVEVKTATGKLEESQIAWHAAWKGQVLCDMQRG